MKNFRKNIWLPPWPLSGRILLSLVIVDITDHFQTSFVSMDLLTLLSTRPARQHVQRPSMGSCLHEDTRTPQMTCKSSRQSWSDPHTSSLRRLLTSICSPGSTPFFSSPLNPHPSLPFPQFTSLFPSFRSHLNSHPLCRRQQSKVH